MQHSRSCQSIYFFFYTKHLPTTKQALLKKNKHTNTFWHSSQEYFLPCLLHSVLSTYYQYDKILQDSVHLAEVIQKHN